jgi:hypothetical protein
LKRDYKFVDLLSWGRCIHEAIIDFKNRFGICPYCCLVNPTTKRQIEMIVSSDHEMITLVRESEGDIDFTSVDILEDGDCVVRMVEKPTIPVGVFRLTNNPGDGDGEDQDAEDVEQEIELRQPRAG